MENRQEHLKKLGDLVKNIKFAMLTTVEEDGALRSRPMATVDFQSDGCLWFFTHYSDPKVKEVEHDHGVNVTFAAPDDNRYVSISGRAYVVRDKDKATELWNPMFKAWFPNGLDDSELALIRVDISRAEYWDAPSSKMVQLFGFAKAENEKLDLTG